MALLVVHMGVCPAGLVCPGIAGKKCAGLNSGRTQRGTHGRVSSS